MTWPPASYFLNRFVWMSSSMASSFFSTSASGSVTLSPVSLLTATHWRCCMSLGPTSTRMGTPWMKHVWLVIVATPSLHCRCALALNYCYKTLCRALFWPSAPSGWTSTQGSSCLAGRPSLWCQPLAVCSGIWSKATTVHPYPAQAVKLWFHMGWWQPRKVRRKELRRMRHF